MPKYATVNGNHAGKFLLSQTARYDEMKGVEIYG